MLLTITHTTDYRFDRPVAHGLQRLRLRPKTTQGQQVLDWTMQLDGATEQVSYDDHHHNATSLVSLAAGVEVLSITCSGTVQTSDKVGIIGQHSGYLPLWAFTAQTPLTKPGPKIRALAGKFKPREQAPLDLLHDLSSAVLAAVSYETGYTDSTTVAEAALGAGHGVCQDHAHVFLSAARLLGVPARYVSGYLMMDDRIDQDAGHAWVEAHVEGLGWVGFDVSNGISPDARYVRVATGRDYREAAPITGLSWGGGDASLSVTLAIQQQMPEQ